MRKLKAQLEKQLGKHKSGIAKREKKREDPKRDHYLCFFL
jgi:hypothetical protein